MEGATGVIKEILDREDIEGLLSVGAPPDEYAPEAKLLAQRLHGWEAGGSGTQAQQARVAGEIREVWRTMFGPLSASDLAQREAAFSRVAAQIVLALPQLL